MIRIIIYNGKVNIFTQANGNGVRRRLYIYRPTTDIYCVLYQAAISIFPSNDIIYTPGNRDGEFIAKRKEVFINIEKRIISWAGNIRCNIWRMIEL